MRKTLLGLLIISLLLTIPGITQRFQAEWNNTTYETVIPLEDIQAFTEDEGQLSNRAVLQRLKDAGLYAVSTEPETLKTLEEKGYITTLTGENIREMAIFNRELEEVANQVATEGVYVYIQEENNLTKRIGEIFSSHDTESVTISGEEFIYIPLMEGKLDENPEIPEIDEKLDKMVVGFLEESIKEIKDSGLSVIFRIESTEVEEDTFVFEQMLELQDERANGLLLSGKNVIGHPDTSLIQEYGKKLKDAKINLYEIEFFKQNGLATLARANDLNLIRLHSLDLNQVTNEGEAVERAVRAVKERNIRSLFIRPSEDDSGEIALQITEEIIQKIQQEMPANFTHGEANSFDTIHVPLWSYLPAFLALILFISLAVLDIFKHKQLFYLSLAGTTLISLGAIILNLHILVQGLALLVAVLTPVYAIVPMKETKGTREILKAYGRAALISLLGITIIVALLNGNEYLVKLQEFRGVKLIYIIPIVFISIYAIIGNIKGLLKANVLYWHLLVMAIIGVIGYYYMSRTGNAGAASSIELMIRQWLEEVMYVRPRTKEFLIGFPLFLLALYVYPMYKKVGLFLLIPSVIGYLSLVNTFTHLHIPLYLSTLRSVYSLVIGLVIGMLFILLFKKGMSIYKEKIKPRWTA